MSTVEDGRSRRPGPLDASWSSLVPVDVRRVFEEYRTAETTTIARDGTPITWPLFPMFRPESGIFQLTTSIGFPDKAFNIRRDERVAMLFSDPTGTGWVRGPAVLVQGMATCADELATDLEPFREDFIRLARAQPISRFYGADPISRRLVDWYFFRLVIDVAPIRVRWWIDGDMTGAPEEVIVDAS